jgi:TolB-like protein
MGEQLGATHLIEGSVRKAGDKLRITAQLIKADDGTHLWAEDYDRQLTDIFQIQEDIARAIANSLRMNAALVDYWKARGWPDMCQPTTADDFECN